MAINPNIDFVSGAVLTADQQNRFPRGIMSYVQNTTTASITTTESVVLTAPAFTAVANRYYRITYYEPTIQTPAGAQNYTSAYIRQTNASGTVYQYGQLQMSGASQVGNTLMLTRVTTLPAGSITLVATLTNNTGTTSAFRGANSPGFLVIEDIGPA